MGTDNIVKEMSAKKIIRKHVSSDFNKESVDAKLKVNFNNGKIKQNISVNLKMIKDEVIWLKGTKFINVFKAKITPTSVKFYSPVAKVYFDGDFTLLKDLLGTEINFNQLQNLFLGQSLLDLKDQKQNVNIEDSSYVLSPEKQQDLFDIFFFINSSHFKLDKQSIVSPVKDQRLDVVYPSYNFIEDSYFPARIKITAKEPNKVNIVFLFVCIFTWANIFG